jgi:hypothetical protein
VLIRFELAYKIELKDETKSQGGFCEVIGIDEG